MKTLLIALATVLFWVVPAQADLDPIAPISVTSTAAHTQINAVKGFLVINDGSAEVFLECDSDTVSTSNSGLKSTDPPMSVKDSCSMLHHQTSSGTATLRVFVMK